MNGLDSDAVTIHELYMALQRAGFTEARAFELTLGMLIARHGGDE